MTGALRSRGDAFRILGLAPQASADDIRTAFRRLAFLTHPDRASGRNDEFSRIREAYELLRDGGGEAGPAAPARPTLEVRVSVVSDEMQAACRALLAEGGRALPGPEDGSPAAGRDHVPMAVRRKGRQVTYLVPTPLAEGTNCVAVPVGDLDDPRRISSKLVRVTSARRGAGRVEVPPEVCDAVFPGARSVAIEFGEV